MRVRWAGLVALFIAVVISPVARADTIDLSVRIVDEKGAPHVGMPVRVVIGTEPESRTANAGARLATNSDGHVSRIVGAAVERRWATGDFLIPRRLDTLFIGVELDLLGRRALYWVTLTDYGSRGALIGVETFVQRRDGTFDLALKRVEPASWRFADQPDGLLMSDIGVKPRAWELESTTLPDGKRRWRVVLDLEKQEFTRR